MNHLPSSDIPVVKFLCSIVLINFFISGLEIFCEEPKYKKLLWLLFENLLESPKINAKIYLQRNNAFKIDDTFNEKLLYSIFNLVEQDNKYLLISSNKPIDTLSFSLPDLVSRLKNCIRANIEQPDDDLIYAIILKSFSDRQIKLDNKIVDYIIKRIARSYSKMHEFIYKIDELSLKKRKSINFKIGFCIN